jgi:uncharacterized protein (DUF305 family)
MQDGHTMEPQAEPGTMMEGEHTMHTMENRTMEEGHAMSMGCGDLTCPSSQAFMHENMEMHNGMAIQFTCDPEVDFVRGMIPHHAGAVVMCDILRSAVNGTGGEHGDHMGRRRAQMDHTMDHTGSGLDSFLDGLCNDIVTGQEAEIAAMEAWLEARGLPVEASCAKIDGHAADHHPPSCNFGELMRLLETAASANDVGMIAASHIYVACANTADAIDARDTCP